MSTMIKKQTVLFVILIVISVYVGIWFTGHYVKGEVNKTDNMTTAQKANQLGRQINCLFWGKWNGHECVANLIIPSVYGEFRK